MGIGKNGVIDSYSFSNQVPIHEMQTKVLDDGSVWARIHWLDVTYIEEFFTNEAEVLKCADKKNRYSRMGLVDEFKSDDGKYEFMLTYPSLSNTLYNRWTQTSSPNATTVTGFTAITTAWSEHNNGLRKHDGALCVYNCDTGNTRYTPIGQLKAWGYGTESTTLMIPSANGTNQTSTELWVRVDTVSKDKVSFYEKCITASDFVEL